MSNHIPLVSIGLPVYNGEKYLRTALDALLNQSFADIEIIISDNASTDGTETMCREYAARDPRIRYFRTSRNRGLSWNYNRVFLLSRGRYFKWAACDDICAPTYLERCVEVLASDPSVVCCHSWTMKIDPEGNPLPRLPDPTDGGYFKSELAGRHRPDGSSPHPHRRFTDVLLSSGWGVRCSGLIRADKLRNTALIQPYYGYEKVLMGELSLQGRFYDIPEILFYQRVHREASSSLSSQKEKQRFVAPALANKRTFPRLHLFAGHLRAIYKYPLGFRNFVLCHRAILRYLLQFQKWKTLLRGTANQTGERALQSRKVPVQKQTTPV